MCFRVGAADAEELVKEFEPALTETDLVNLGKYDVYMKLMIDGISSDPFSATTSPPLIKEGEEESHREKIIKVSRERYAEPKDVVEEKILRWSKAIPDIAPQATSAGSVGQNNRFSSKPGAQGSSYSNSNSHVRVDRPEFDALCSNCGVKFTLPFDPDPGKPVYCRECFAKVKSGEINPIKNSTKPRRTDSVNSIKTEPRSISLKEAVDMGDKMFGNKSFKSTNNQSQRAPQTKGDLLSKQNFSKKPTSNQKPANNQAQNLKPGATVKFE